MSIVSTYRGPSGCALLARFEQVALEVLHSRLVRVQWCARVLPESQVVKQGTRCTAWLLRWLVGRLGDLEFRPFLLLDEERALCGEARVGKDVCQTLFELLLGGTRFAEKGLALVEGVHGVRDLIT